MTIPSIEKRKGEFEQAIERLHHDFGTIRTGRASPALVEGVLVESYGSTSPLKNIASISLADSRTIVIQPWDKSLSAPIEKAITAANLGLQPVSEGARIRLVLPSLTEERRRDVVKLVRQKAEDRRVSIRSIREEIWREVVQQVKEKQLTEDDKYDAQEELKKVVEHYNALIKDLVDKKEAEVMTV